MVVLVRVANATRSEKWLVLSGNGSLLSLLDIVQILFGFGVPLGVTRKGARQATLPALGVGARSVWALWRGVMLDGRLGRTAGVAVRIVFAASRNFVVDAHGQHAALHGGRQQVNSPCAPALHAKSHEKTGGK